MLKEDIRKEINSNPLFKYVSLKRSNKAGKGKYICPVCGSGTGRNGTGALHIYDNNRVVCFAKNCFTDKGEDTLGALETIWNCNESEVFERLKFKVDRETPREEHQAKPIEKSVKKESKDYSLFYRDCHRALKNSPEALEYLHNRGITDESIERFNLGYCETWKHEKAPDNAPKTRRIIIPRTNRTYTARQIDKPKTEAEAGFLKQVQGSQKDLFNMEALETAETLFICEGELDTISLIQAGAAAVVGIGTTTNTGVILEEAKKHPDTVFILALDNDPDKEDGKNPGKDSQRELSSGMKAAGLEVMNVNPADLYGSAKDANEALTEDPERLGRMIAILESKAQEIRQAKQEEREALKRKCTGEGMIEDFLLTVTDSGAKTYAPIETGIAEIDRALEGGFIRKTLVTLGAPPATGKTALAQWIFENIAMKGQDVLYINLEMARDQLLARSISRIAYKYNKKDFSTLEVLRGYAWTDEQRDAITTAAERYKKEIAPRFMYNPEGVTNKLDSILSAMESETIRIKAQGREAPLVCIDYLQLVDSGERDAMEGMKTVIFKLKDWAKNNNSVVFLIIANNRESNKTGTVEMESGRDTSAIEYSGDFMLGLSYTAIEDKRKVMQEDIEYFEKAAEAYDLPENYEDLEKGELPGIKVNDTYTLDTIRRMKRLSHDLGLQVPAVCNEISLKVLKSRYTESDHRVKLVFDGRHSTYKVQEITRDKDGFSNDKSYVNDGLPFF